MTNTEFQREVKEDKPVIALCYDFDKTYFFAYWMR